MIHYHTHLDQRHMGLYCSQRANSSRCLESGQNYDFKRIWPGQGMLTQRKGYSNGQTAQEDIKKVHSKAKKNGTLKSLYLCTLTSTQDLHLLKSEMLEYLYSSST